MKKEMTIVVPCINKKCSDYSKLSHCNCRFGKPVPMNRYKSEHRKSYIVCKNYKPEL